MSRIYSELKCITILYNGVEHGMYVIDVPRKGDTMTLYFKNAYSVRVRVDNVKWTASWDVEDAGYPEVTVYVSRIE